MAYLNHAGTSWPKPGPVRAAVAEALETPADRWGERFDHDHRFVARAFGIADASRLLLTPGCTSALSVAIADLPWERGDRVLTSGLEHNALVRPVSKLAARGVEWGVVPRDEAGPLSLERLEDELRRGRVRLVAMTAACNVTGELLPFARVAELAHEYGALCLIDAAQVAGWLPLDVTTLGADMLAFAGHKGLQAPWGIGGLYVAPHVTMDVPGATCELRPGEVPACAPMPGYCDTGSVDRCALAGLVAGLGWLEQQPERLARARGQLAELTEALERLGWRVHGVRDPAGRLPSVALGLGAHPASEVVSALNEVGVQVGAGELCAPLAYESLCVESAGVCRVSLGPAHRAEELEAALEAFREVTKRLG